MNFDLTPEQLALKEEARVFSEEHIKPVAHRYDRDEIFPRDVLEALGPSGLMTPTLEPALGGSGGDFIGEALVFEEIGKECSSVRTILTVHNSLCTLSIQRWGTEEQKARYLPEMGHGRTLGCFALTEFSAGSEATKQNLSAQRVTGGWILNGRKAWVSSGSEADICLLFAQTEPEKGYKGITAFLVPTEASGFSTEKVAGKTGLRAAHTAHLSLVNVVLGEEQLLGRVGDGFKIAMSALDNGRYGVAAGCVGQAQSCLDASISYAQERVAFGKPIASKQLVQEMLADMAVAVESARLLVYLAGHKKNQGVRNTYETSMAKLVATETAVEVARKAVQVHGAVGYTDAYPVERHLRDALATTIYEGTSQIQKLIIGRHLTGESAFV
jgi:hypothetical protein